MKNITTAALALLAMGIFTSVTILSAYQVLFAIVCAYYSFWAIKENKTKLPTSAWFLLTFAAVALLSLVINFELLPKPTKNFGRLKYFAFGIAGIFVLRVWLTESSLKTKKYLCNLFLTSILIAATFGIYKFYTTDDDRLRGFTDTLRYGYGMSMILLTLLSALLHHEKIKDWFNFRLGLTTLIVGLAALYLTYNRGSLLALMCGLPFVLYFYRAKLGLTLGGLAVAGVLGLVGIYLFGTGNYNSRFLVNKNNPSDHIRRSQWQAAIIATKEKPILGWGLSNFHSQLNRIKQENDLDAKWYNDAHAHNLFLEVASGTGLIGLFFFLGWVLSWGWEIFRKGGLLRALIFPFGIAFIVGSQFEVTFDANNASMIFFLYSMSFYES